MTSLSDLQHQTEARDVQVVKFILLVGGIFLLGLGATVLASPQANRYLLSLLSFFLGKPPAPHWMENLRLLALEAVLLGGIVILVGLFGVQRWRLLLPLAQRRGLLLAAALLLLVLWTPVAVLGHSATVQGDRYWWLRDDAMISMRYARNLAEGHGLVWNPGERVEGYSNFLWTLYMALIHRLPIPTSTTSLFILLTNIVLSLVTLPALFDLTRALGGGRLAQVASMIGFVASANLMVWMAAGFETPLLTLLFLYALYRVVEEARWNQPSLWTFFVAALLLLVRADGMALGGLVYAFAFFAHRDKKRVFGYGVVSMLLPVAYELFRLSYYGDFLPNTAYLKTMAWSGKYAAGLKYVAQFGLHYVLLLGCAAVGAVLFFSRVQRLLLGVVLVYSVYIVIVGGDVFDNFRFFVPVVPVVLELGFLAVERFSLSTRAQLVLTACCLLTMPLLVPGYLLALRPRAAEQGNLELGLFLKRNTPPSASVADFWAGSTLYFSERYGVDLLGKSDQHIAHSTIAKSGGKPGHNKYDFDYSLGVLHPDYVIANFKLPVDPQAMERASQGNYPFTGDLYFHPLFREFCLPHPVPGNTWRTVFACDWSPATAAAAKP